MYFLFHPFLKFGVPYLVISSMRICYGSSNDVFFVVQKYEPVEFICVTNSSGAITWCPKDDHKINQESTAKIRKTNYTNLRKTVSKEFILDRRWEELDADKTILRLNDTSTQSFTKQMKFFNNSDSNFKVPISILTSENSIIEIFLCENTVNATCYNFELRKKLINVLKCKQTLIECETVTYRENRNIILNAWNHFIISRQNNWIELSSSNEEYSHNNTLKFFDNKVLNATSIVVATSTVGLWKIHENEFFYITTTHKKVNLLESIKIVDNFFCVSMFVKTCDSCQIKLQLTVSGDEDYILKDEIFGPYNKWNEIKFIVRGVKKEKLDLLLQTIKLNEDEENLFWSYSNIQQCYSSELRMIKRKDSAKCQLMSEGTYNILDVEENTQNNINYGPNSCTEDTISSNCIPCSWFTKNKDCGQMKICEKYGSEIKCSCSAGYNINSAQECKNSCSRGFFGFSCNKKCGKCLPAEECNYVDGTCPRCAGKYIGPKCDTPRGALFKMAPTVTDVAYTTALVAFKNFDLQDVLENERATNFIVEYKTPKQEQWEFYTKKEYSFDATEIRLSNLKPGTKYFMRGVIKTDNGTIYTGNDLPIPYTEFKTICDDINKKNFELHVSSTSVNLSFVENTNTCKTNNFNVTLINVNDFSKQPNQTLEPFSKFIIINKLLPHTHYKMLIYVVGGRPFRKDFRTTEGIPEEVKNLNITEGLENELLITWQKPDSFNGVFQDYVVEYEILSHAKNSKRKHVTTKKTFVTLHGIPSSGNYSVSVFARNSKFQGKLVTKCRINSNFSETFSLQSTTPQTTKFPTLTTIIRNENISPGVPFFKEEATFSSTQNTISINISTDLVNFNERNSCEMIILMKRNFGNEVNSQHWEFLYQCELKKSNFLYLVIGSRDSKNKYCFKSNANQPLEPATLYNIKIIVNNTNFKNSITTYNYNQYTQKEENSIEKTTSHELIFIIVILSLCATTILMLHFLIRTKNRNKKTKYSNLRDTEENLLTQFNDQRSNLGYNTFQKDYCSQPIKTAHFQDYVKKSLENRNLVKQHKTIMEKVTSKIYECVAENLHWDYIHLGENVIEKAYIVSEMPNGDNLKNFWEIVWSENINNIIFLDNNKTLQQNFSCENISVLQISCQQFDNYTQKKCRICKETSKEINQFHLSVWTKDHFPFSPSTLTPFFQKILQLPRSSKSPILVTSNSMDGAGFILLCDICLRNAKNNGEVDVLKVADILANCNLDLISYAKNYILAHLIILENILYQENAIDSRLENLPTLSQIDKQFEGLKKITWLDQATKMLKTEVQFNKNIDTYIYLPVNVQDTAYSYTDMLNLVRVDGFKCSEKFIVTQQPTQFSATYFWTTVQENNVNVITIMHLSPKNLKQCIWFPTKNRPVVKPSNCNIIITYKETKKLKKYLWISVDIEDKEKKRKVDLFFVNDWLFGYNCPCNVKDFVRFCSESRNKIVNDSNPVMVTCWDGRKGSGLYIALFNILEQINVEGKSDISRQVRLVKSHHQEFLTSQEQFRYLWDAAEFYIKESVAYEVA